MKWISMLLIMVLMAGCCKATVSIGVQKDWSVDSHPLDSEVYHPDCRTDLRLSFEKDFSKK